MLCSIVVTVSDKTSAIGEVLLPLLSDSPLRRWSPRCGSRVQLRHRSLLAAGPHFLILELSIQQWFGALTTVDFGLDPKSPVR